jgi:hypothetical protein
MATAGEQHTAGADAVADLICEVATPSRRAALRAAQADGASRPLPPRLMLSRLEGAAPTHAQAALAQAWASVQAYDRRDPDHDRWPPRDKRLDDWARKRLMELLFEQAEDPRIRAALFNEARATYLDRARDGDLRLVAQLERLHGDLAIQLVNAAGVTSAELTALKASMPCSHAALVAFASNQAAAVLGVAVGLSDV